MRKYLRKYKKKKPLISIITVVLNGERHIEKAIKSVLNQSYKNFEYIIIDGQSSDKTLKIIKKYKSKIDYWISEKDKGIYDAMNKGIKISKGAIIGILNSDDFYKKNALKIVSKYFSKNKSLDFLFGSIMKNRLMSGYHPEKIKWKFNIYPGHSSGFFIKKLVHDKIGLYNTKFKYSADYDLIYKLIVKYKFKGMCTKSNEITGVFRTDGIGSKVGFLGKLSEETKIRIHNKQNIFFVCVLCVLHLMNFIFNKIKNI